MIISASRRTDIPAFYSEWFMHRIRDGFCQVSNPYNSQQVSTITLDPEAVDVIVFWTRNPAPLLKHLPELDNRGYHYYFQYSLLGYPSSIEPFSPPLPSAIETFWALSKYIGAERIIWRYDPIVLSSLTPAEYHLEVFSQIAAALEGATKRVVISILDEYNRITAWLKQMAQAGTPIYQGEQIERQIEGLAPSLVKLARLHGMGLTSCAEEIDLQQYGIRPGKCIDDAYIHTVFGLDVCGKKDVSQRKACGCVESKDIGAYNSCLFGCKYCYACGNNQRIREKYGKCDSKSLTICG